MSGTQGACAVEKALAPEDLLDLDMLLADPSRWPRAIFEGWHVPQGSPVGAMRTWGAIEVGLNWARERDVAVTKNQMRRHYEQHVPILPTTTDDVVARGVAASTPGTPTRAPLPGNPNAYIELYQRGIAVGNRALELLMERIDTLVRDGKEVPVSLLMDVGNLGVKLATSQAGIVSRGFDLARQKEEEIDGFRAAPADPSPRFGDHRIHVVEGEARPVVDRGRADRREYNEKAAQDGSPRLPA